MFAPDSQEMYYHLNTTHILRKNPEFYKKVSIISLSSRQTEVINKSGLIISV